ncbi:MAG: MFS transporter [Pseudomonadota bacterium]
MSAAPPRSGASPAQGEALYAVLYGGLFMALGAQMAFLQLWLEDWGLEAAEIGWVFAVSVAVRIAAGLIAPALSDHLGRPGAVMAAMALAGIAAAAALALAGTRLEIYLAAAALSASYAALIPLSDAHGFASAERIGFSYRRARSVGSAAFLLATILCGLSVEWFGADATLWWIALPYAVVAVAALAAPKSASPASDETALAPIEEPLAAPSRPATPAQGALGWSWARRPRFLLFLLAVAAVQSSHAVYYNYGSVHWRALGYSETVIGALWSWGVIAEIGVFFIGAALMRRLGPANALALAGAAAILRWTAMSVDPPFLAVIALQTLHGLTFGLAHLAALAFAQDAAPPGRAATAQGVVSASAGGVGMLIATLAAASAYPALGGGAYAIGAALGLIAVFAALRLGSARPA